MPLFSSRARALSLSRGLLLLGAVQSVALTFGVIGCSTMSQDVHQYYTTMAQNYDEAAEKTKMQIVGLKSKARELIQVGEIGKAKKIQHEITKIEDWQVKCYRERDRFAKAADDLERKNAERGGASMPKSAAGSAVATKNATQATSVQ